MTGLAGGLLFAFGMTVLAAELVAGGQGPSPWAQVRRGFGYGLSLSAWTFLAYTVVMASLTA